LNALPHDGLDPVRPRGWHGLGHRRRRRAADTVAVASSQDSRAACETLRDETMADAELVALITKKFSIKCVTGYGINAAGRLRRPSRHPWRHLLRRPRGHTRFHLQVILNTVPARSRTLEFAAALRQSRVDCKCRFPLIDRTGPSAVEFLTTPQWRPCSASGSCPSSSRPGERGQPALLVELSASNERERQGGCRGCAPGVERAPWARLDEPLHHYAGGALAPCGACARTCFAIVGGARVARHRP